MSLQQFILDNLESILEEWECYAVTLPPARSMDRKALRNDAGAMITRIAQAMGEPQTSQEQERQARREVPEHSADETLGGAHASARRADGFDLNQLMGEFRALRASIVKLWVRSPDCAGADALYQLTRFNEALDYVLAESLARFARELDRSREIFLGVLGHDLRSPLGAISMSAEFILLDELLSPKSASAANRILRSSDQMAQMLSDLLDVTRTRLGSTLPLSRVQANVGEICREVVEQARASHPEREFMLKAHGDLQGSWDRNRLTQLLTNLEENAVQHGEPGALISIEARRGSGEVTAAVHNEGRAIPEDRRDRIFEPMYSLNGEKTPGKAGNLGLGLYIARLIALAHQGSLKVESGPHNGTTFLLRLPAP